MKKSAALATAILLMGGLIYSASSIVIIKPGFTTGMKPDTWILGSTKDIKWKNNGDCGSTVTLMLYNGNNTIKFNDIAVNTANDESHPWPIPSNITPGKYVIRVVSNTNVKANSITFNLAKAELKKAPDFKVRKLKPADLIPSATANIGKVNTVSRFSIGVKNIGEMTYGRKTCDWIKFYYYGPDGTSTPSSIYDMKKTWLPDYLAGGATFSHEVQYTFTVKGVYSYRVYVNPPECQFQTGPDPDSNLMNNGLVEKRFTIE